MKILQIYPIIVSKTSTLFKLEIEEGGILIEKEKVKYYNSNSIVLDVSRNNIFTGKQKLIEFKDSSGRKKYIDSFELNEASNLEEKLKFITKPQKATKKAELEILMLELEELNLMNLIDYALSTNNEKMFMDLTEKKE